MASTKAETVRTHSTAEEVGFFARHALDSSSPLFVLVLFRRNQRRDDFVEDLSETLSASKIKTRVFDLASGDGEPPFLYTELESLGEREVALVTRLPQAPGGLALDSDYLKYLNFHRDRMAFRRFRWVLFLHEMDVEQFQREAGDLWDFRQHTFWLDGEPAEPGERVWLNVERSIDAYGSQGRLIETSREEIDEHCRRVRSQVELTEDEEEKAALLGDLAGWLLRRGAYEPAVAVVEEALRKVPDSAASRRAELEGLAGRALEGTGDLERAVEHFFQQIDFLVAAGDHRAEARAWIRLSKLERTRKRFEEALDALKRSAKLSEELGDLRAQATTQFSLGELFDLLGHLDRANDHYRKLLEIGEKLDHQRIIATAYHQLGILSQKTGSYDEALDWYRNALAINEKLGDRAGMAISYHQLGIVAQEAQDYEKALELYGKALAIMEALGNSMGIAISYHQLGRVAEERGSYDEAREWYRKALGIFIEMENYPVGMASTMSHLGRVETKRGRTAKAVPLNLRSLTIYLEIESPSVQNDLHWLGRQRTELGEGRFVELVTEQVGEDGAARVLEWLDEYEAASETSED